MLHFYGYEYFGFFFSVSFDVLRHVGMPLYPSPIRLVKFFRNKIKTEPAVCDSHEDEVYAVVGK